MQTQGVDRGASNAACPITKVHVPVTYNIPAAVLHTSTPSFIPVFVLVHACLVQTAHSKFGVHVPQGETPSRPQHRGRARREPGRWASHRPLFLFCWALRASYFSLSSHGAGTLNNVPFSYGFCPVTHSCCEASPIPSPFFLRPAVRALA
ncbi:hypothetical protein J3E69DRAFT_95617 [Trichoderma sp. SZMC 28015]